MILIVTVDRDSISTFKSLLQNADNNLCISDVITQ